MTDYYVYIIYEDGSEYQSIIKNQKDVDKIPKNKKYEGIRIFYPDKIHSHIIYGKDNIFFHYYEDDQCLYYAAFNEINIQEFVKVVKLHGVGKEKEFTEATKGLPQTFKGKELPSDEWEKIRQKCHQWSPP